MKRFVPYGCASVAILGLAFGGCDKSAAPAGPKGRLALNVRPLDLPGIQNAHYAVTVTTALGQTVWQEDDLSSVVYGNGPGGDIAYVGSCDASAGANPHTVTVDITQLDVAGSPLPADEWADPGPISQTVNCIENEDVSVVFNLTILRDANQGFFDVGVTFDNIYCSAKLDCAKDGQALNLLFDPSEDARDSTIVFAMACAAAIGGPTILYLTDIEVQCGAGAANHTYQINPALGPGNLGGEAPFLFETATYWGQEGYSNVDKCYWNTSIGIDLDGTGGGNATDRASCVLTARGTASPTPFINNHTPDDAVWPVIEWNVPLTDVNGTLICGQNPVGGVGSGVTVAYSKYAATPFAHHYTCGETPGNVPCIGMDQGFTGTSVMFQEVEGGFQVAVDGTIRSAIALPPGIRLGGCCCDPAPFQ